MNAYLSTASLLIYPVSPDWFPDPSADLVTHLHDIGFIDTAIDTAIDPASHQAAYFAGELFLEQIAFMGCAPSIRFAPDADSAHFTHIRLHQYQRITALTGAHTRAPNCPQCKKAFSQWNTRLDSLAADSQWTCEHCQHSAPPWEYQWGKSAGFARVFIEVTDIYPKEALPQQALLDSLQVVSATPWGYAYLF